MVCKLLEEEEEKAGGSGGDVDLDLNCVGLSTSCGGVVDLYMDLGCGDVDLDLDLFSLGLSESVLG